MKRHPFLFLPRLMRISAVAGGLALLSACSGPGGDSSGGTEPAGTAGASDTAAASGPGAGASTGEAAVSQADDLVTTAADLSTTISLEHSYVPPPEGVPLPFPDADVAQNITPGKQGGQFIYVSFGEGPKTFNPITSNDSSSGEVVGLMYSGLIGYDPVKQEYMPGLATEWKMDPDDKRIWIIRLRKGVQWSDGHPFTADDVLFGVETIYDTRYNSAARDIMQVNGQPLKFEKIDDHTIRVIFPEPSGFARTLISAATPIPRHAYGEMVKNGTFESELAAGVSPEKLVVIGPFKLKQYQSGERVILERNPYYWRVDQNGTRLPYLDNFIITYAPDKNQMEARFQRGDADGFARPMPASIPGLRDGQQQGNYTLHDLGPGMATDFVWFNLKPGSNPSTGKPYVDPVKSAWFSDPRFRQAVLYGINRDAIIRTELRGLAVPATGKESVANKFWYNPNVPKYKYDRKKAAALLDEMGLTLKPGQQWRTDAQGNPVSFTLITNKGNNVRERVAGLIAQDLRGLNIEVKPQYLDFNALLTLTDSTYEYEAVLLGLTGGSFEPASGMNAWLSSGRTNLYNPRQETPFTEWQAEIDRLAKEMVASVDLKKQRENYFRMQEISAEYLPLLPLWHQKEFVPVRNTFGNVRPSILNPYLLWNADEFYVKQ